MSTHEFLSVYIPVDRRHALARGQALPERTNGAALFADLSGFSPLTETLTRTLGPRRGAEELAQQLNLVYDALIAQVDRYGGSVIGFAGDAITCWFDERVGGLAETGDLSLACLRAVACALAMQQAMQPLSTVSVPGEEAVTLAVKVAIASGPARRFLVGDPAIQVNDALAGKTLARMAAAEHLAARGEVVLDRPTLERLNAEWVTITEWRSDPNTCEPFAVVAHCHRPVAPAAWPPLDSVALSEEQLRAWVLPAVYERLQTGAGEFLTELRPAVALFMRFGGIDYDEDEAAGAKLDAYIRWVQQVVARYDGALLQLTIGDKGSYLYVAFGAPITHEDDPRRAVCAALELRTPPADLSFIHPLQIGISQGTMRAGAYGGRTRRTYGALGDEVNLAARLMQHAGPGEVLVSRRVQKALTAGSERFDFEPRVPVQLKGRVEPVPVFAVTLASPQRAIRLQEPGYALPMVGRSAELERVEQKIAQVLQGKGQVIGITAEAGMGKSRLVAEIIRLARRRNLTGLGGRVRPKASTPLIWCGSRSGVPSLTSTRLRRCVGKSASSRALSRTWPRNAWRRCRC